MTTDDHGHVALHKEHAAVRAPRSPSIFVYELWDHTSLILQYRAYQGYCVHRTFNPTNGTEFNDNYAYTIETAMHEWMLASPHRTLDGEAADFYYIPSSKKWMDSLELILQEHPILPLGAKSH